MAAYGVISKYGLGPSKATNKSCFDETSLCTMISLDHQGRCIPRDGHMHIPSFPRMQTTPAQNLRTCCKPQSACKGKRNK